MILERLSNGRFLPSGPALLRFASKCRFEPETGCVIWTGSKTRGKGHYVDYGYFWFEGRMVLAHRWSAHHIRGLDIAGLQVDHCCPNIPHPNTLCVEHGNVETLSRNRELQTQRAAERAFHERRKAIHAQVGYAPFEDIYGPQPEPIDLSDLVPIFPMPAWLAALQGPTHAADDCPF